MAAESCMVGLLGEHTLAELCCGNSETLQRCFCPSSCSLIFATVQSGLCTLAFCSPYCFQSSEWGLAAKWGGEGRFLSFCVLAETASSLSSPHLLKKIKKRGGGVETKKKSSLLAIRQRSQLSCRQTGRQAARTEVKAA